jgi:hypothetical protein
LGSFAGVEAGNGRDGGGGRVAVGGHAEADGLGAAGGGALDLGELVVGGGEADLEPFGFACPALLPGLGDAGRQVVADALEPLLLDGVDPQERAADAAVLVDAACSPGAAAIT